MLYSQELEKLVLAGILKFPNSFHETSGFIEEGDFAHDINRIVFSVLRNAIHRNEPVDKTLIAQKILNLGASFKDEISPFDYLDALSMTPVTVKTMVSALKDLKVFTRRRQFVEVAEQIRKKMIKGKDMSYEEVNRWVDATFYEKMNSFYSASDAVDLFETMYDRAEELAMNPKEELGFATPYPTFNEMYGGFQVGEVYVFCSRPKQGKTSWLNATAIQMSNVIHKLPCLILDTEMQEDMIGDRVLASMTDIPLWHLRTGNWGKYAEYQEAFKKEKARQAKDKYQIYHKYVMNMPIEEVIQVIKRWYYTKVGRGNPCIVVYDYIKMTGESLSDHNKEYQVIGEKINKLKELVGKEVNAPLITAMQLNRSGENKKGKQNDDSTAISLSDRALWFASYVGIFRRKTLEELSEYGTQFGSHTLIHIESRWQGRSGKGHMDSVKDHNGNIVSNFTNFDVDNFKVQERGSAEDMFKKLSFTPESESVQSPFDRRKAS